MLRCSCGSFIGWQSYCPTCGKKRQVLPLLILVGLIAGTVVVALVLSRPRTPAQRSEGALTSHRVTAPRDPKQAMAEVDAMLKRGDQASCLGAVALLDDLLAHYPDFGYGLRLKANLLRDLRRDKEALIAYQTFLAAHPEDQRTRLAMADVLLRGPQPQQGLAVLAELATQYPNYAEVHERLIVAYTRANQPDRAEAHRKLSAALSAQKTAQKPPFVYLPRLPGHNPAPGS